MPWSEADDQNLNTSPPDYATAVGNQRNYGSMQVSSPAGQPREISQQQIMSDAMPNMVGEETELLTKGDTRKRKRMRRLKRCVCVSACNTVS